MARKKKTETTTEEIKPEVQKKKRSSNKKRTLQTVKETSSVLRLDPDAACIIFNADNTMKVLIGEDSEQGGVYKPYEELCIALAALCQNPTFTEQVLKTFRDLFDAAIAKAQTPENSID